MLALDPRWLGRDRNALRGFVGLAGPYDFLPLADPATIAAFEGETDLAKTQPVSLVSADDPPSLLLHGLKDTLVYPRNSQELADRLAQSKVDARVKYYSQLGHIGMITALARPFRSRAPVLNDVVSFATEMSERENARHTVP